jgi:phage shock protein A
MEPEAARADVPSQPGEASQLEGELERLTHQIERLEAALTPALGPTRPVSALVDKIAEESSHLRSLRIRFSAQVDRLSALTGRLEL